MVSFLTTDFVTTEFGPCPIPIRSPPPLVCALHHSHSFGPHILPEGADALCGWEVIGFFPPPPMDVRGAPRPSWTRTWDTSAWLNCGQRSAHPRAITPPWISGSLTRRMGGRRHSPLGSSTFRGRQLSPRFGRSVGTGFRRRAVPHQLRMADGKGGGVRKGFANLRGQVPPRQLQSFRQTQTQTPPRRRLRGFEGCLLGILFGRVENYTHQNINPAL